MQHIAFSTRDIIHTVSVLKTTASSSSRCRDSYYDRVCGTASARSTRTDRRDPRAGRFSSTATRRVPAADLHQAGRGPPDAVLRDHPAQGGRRLRQGKLQGPVRGHRSANRPRAGICEAMTVSLPPSTETGPLGVQHLKRFWARSVLSRSGQLVAPEEFRRDRVVLHALGIALEDAMRFLPNASTYEEFEAWIVDQSGGSVDPERMSIVNAIVSGTEYDEKWRSHLRSIDEMDPVLTSADIDFWHANGFVILHDAVSADACRAAAEVVWSSVAASPEDPETWYGHQNRQGIMVQAFGIRHWRPTGDRPGFTRHSRRSGERRTSSLRPIGADSILRKDPGFRFPARACIGTSIYPRGRWLWACRGFFIWPIRQRSRGRSPAFPDSTPPRGVARFRAGRPPAAGGDMGRNTDRRSRGRSDHVGPATASRQPAESSIEAANRAVHQDVPAAVG